MGSSSVVFERSPRIIIRNMGCGHSEPTTIEPIDKLDNDYEDPPPSSPPIKKVDDAPPPGVVEHPATPEKLQEEPEDVEEMHENEAEPNNETAEDETKEEEATEK